MYDTTKALDRVLRERPKDFPPERIKTARDWLVGYRRQITHNPNVPPPDDNIVAQFLAIALWPELEHMLKKLFSQGIQPRDSHAWFVTVGLQRIHGIEWTEHSRVRSAALRALLTATPRPIVQQ